MNKESLKGENGGGGQMQEKNLSVSEKGRILEAQVLTDDKGNKIGIEPFSHNSLYPTG